MMYEQRLNKLLVRSMLCACVALPALTSAVKGKPDVEKVERWGIFELTLGGPSGGNPFVDVKLSAEFEQNGSIFKPEGFYDGDGAYRIRFMPDEPGE